MILVMNFFTPWRSKSIQLLSASDSVTTPRPYWKCLKYAPSWRAFIKPPETQDLKKRRARCLRTRPLRLQAGDVRRLQALGAACDFELNRLAFVQRFVTIRHDGGKVDENVLAGLALDESKAFAGVKPLDCPLLFQLCFSFLFGLFGAFPLPPAQKKGLQV